MGSEHSVVTALAELGRLEQERVEGERRQAARQRVQALEQELARQATERFERELERVRTQLRAEHDAHAQQLQERIDALQLQLAAAEAGRDMLRAALAAQQQLPPRAGKLVPALLAAVACTLAAFALGQQLRSAQLETLRREITTARAAAALVDAPSSRAASPAIVPALAPAPQRPARDAVEPAVSGTRRPATRGAAKPAGAKPRPRPAPERDVLSDLDSCPESDPTCGLELR